MILILPPPVLADKVQAQDIPRDGGPQESREGVGESISQPRKDQIVHLRLVLHLTDQHSAQVNCGFCPVHASPVCPNWPLGELNPTLRAWYPSP